jgi:hypothetical protein
MNRVFAFVSTVPIFFLSFALRALRVIKTGEGCSNLGKKCICALPSSGGILYISIGPDIRQDYPLNLSILISGGKETNKDSPSNGE